MDVALSIYYKGIFMPTETSEQDMELARELLEARNNVTTEIRKVIIGQDEVIEDLLVALFSRGHCLFVGVPGLAKTLLVSSLAKILNLKFSRIQFTPDLMPSDITGTEILYEDQATKHREFRFIKGPIFSNIILADEINRAPAKTQSALLEAMQERQVTIGGQTFRLPEPFITLATQNPIEQEGTYPLPEAQVDRFMLKLKVDYPSREEEVTIVNRMARDDAPKAGVAARPEDLAEAIKVINQIYVDPKIIEYIVNIVDASRFPEKYRLKLAHLIHYGASPRASIYLTRAARARAFLNKRGYVTPDDVKASCPDVLRHRIVPTYEADAENVAPEDILKIILDNLEVP